MPLLTDFIVDRHFSGVSCDFQSGAVMLIDKPLEWTSFDVVNKLRFKLKHGLGIKKIKVGHAGTLDPLATGLLIVCTGKLTKSIDEFQGMPKVYSGTIFIGKSTPTYDAESIPDDSFPTAHISENLIKEVSKKFLGDIEQMPPIYSAIKVNGTSAYSLARRGKDVELKPRNVNITQFDILDYVMPNLPFICACSKGTYIRSLAHDFGISLNSGAYLSSLRRDAIGPYRVENAMSLDEALEFIERMTTVRFD